jgi:CRP-like cAMP-binding protein
MSASPWHLKRAHLLRRLPVERLRRLEAAARSLRLPRGAVVFGPDDPGGAVWLVVSGRLWLSRFDAEGDEILLAVLEEGDVVGLPTPAAAYLECLEPSDLLAVPTADYEAATAP